MMDNHHIIAEQRFRPQAPNQINFTALQLAYLDKLFPEADHEITSEATLRHRVGQRSVIAHIRDKVR